MSIKTDSCWMSDLALLFFYNVFFKFSKMQKYFYNQKHRKIKCSFSLRMNVQTSLHQSPTGWAPLFLHSTLQKQGSYQQCGPANVALHS